MSQICILHFVWQISWIGKSNSFTLPGLSKTDFRKVLTPQCSRKAINTTRVFLLWSHLLCSYESGVAQIVDENLVDEAVLSKGLDHHHPLGTKLQQDVGDVQHLKTVQQRWVYTHPGGGRKFTDYYFDRNSPRYAPGRRSGSRTGWPPRCGPLQRCSGPAQAGWCFLGHWCCSCASSQTGSPPGRLKDNGTVIFHRRTLRWLSWTFEWLSYHEYRVVAHWGSLLCHLGNRDLASLCTAGARSSSPGPSGGVWF